MLLQRRGWIYLCKGCWGDRGTAARPGDSPTALQAPGPSCLPVLPFLGAKISPDSPGWVLGCSLCFPQEFYDLRALWDVSELQDCLGNELNSRPGCVCITPNLSPYPGHLLSPKVSTKIQIPHCQPGVIVLQLQWYLFTLNSALFPFGQCLQDYLLLSG